MERYRKYYKLDSIALMVSIIAVVISIVHSFYFFSEQGELTEKQFIYQEFVSENYKSVFENSSEADEEARKEVLYRLIDQRKQDYITNNENLTLFTQLLTAFLVLGALILFYDPNEFQMPFIEVTIPATLFHLFVTFGLVYLWLQFGLALNTGVDGRLALNHLIQYAESSQGAEVSKSFSEVHTLLDKGIVDAWCHWYYRVFDRQTHGTFHNVISWIGLYVVYAGFWGAIHAVALMLSTTIYEKKRHKRGGKLLLVLFIATVFLLAAASVTFVVEFHHASRLIGAMWLVSTLFIIYWIKWGRSVADVRSSE